jgi:hypothetical protein
LTRAKRATPENRGEKDDGGFSGVAIGLPKEGIKLNFSYR